MTKFAPYDEVAYSTWAALNEVCPPGSFTTVTLQSLLPQVPVLAPSGLVPKLLDTAVVMHSGTGATSVVCVNYYRDDPRVVPVELEKRPG